MDQNKYNTLYNSLNTVYEPAKQLIQQQQAQIPGQFDAERAGLEQAKMNAFRDISSKARGMGVAFGGYSPSEQARYTGATYLPAMGNIGARQSAASTALQEALNNIGIKQTESATGMYQTQVANEAAAANEQAKQAEQQRQFEQQMQMEKYKANLDAETSRYNASLNPKTPPEVDPYKGFTTTQNESGGTNFYGPGNQPITAAQFYYTTGGGSGALENFLKNDPQSKSAYQYYNSVQNLVKSGGIDSNTASQMLVEKYPYIFGS